MIEGARCKPESSSSSILLRFGLFFFLFASLLYSSRSESLKIADCYLKGSEDKSYFSKLYFLSNCSSKY